MIALANVTKNFGSRRAVDDLTLTVPRGEIFGLLGHNGAGKSTAIGMMLGQVWPTSGAVKVCGHDVTTQRTRALEKVGAIFEAPAFYDYLSGWRNLEILSHYTAPTPKERIREVVDWVGLTGREKSKVKTYSHGMRARLALAQALLPRPDLLILDEPGSGLDPEGIAEMRQTIVRLHRELGLTILLSSHLLGEVEQLCSRIAVLNQGRKVFEGSLEETKRRNQWVRLRVNDFPLAAKVLTEARLISNQRDGHHVALVEGVDTDAVVRKLVEQGVGVFEVVREAETLESFYLSLMNQNRAEKK
ncbi:MAG: ABC transporter ATP-binding protein [Pedosphaera sp.]|nr:ABC transporter ATP-binding protein [Pedosphaera sp.]